MMDSTTVQKGDYGIDAPVVVRNLIVIGCALIIPGLALWLLVMGSLVIPARILGSALFFSCALCLFEAGYMLWSSKVGKYWEREHLVELVGLQGDEQVLDVGCGRGLILTAAARHLSRGRATGLDIWNKQDQSGNDPAVTRRNAAHEGVLERIEIVDGDARAMPFENDHFDVVLSSLVIHNIAKREERQQALREIMRVLKPGGRLALLDFVHVKEYADDLHTLGAQDVRIEGPHFTMFPFVRIVTGRKSV